MHLSGAESLAAAANVFLGQTEAPLVIKPYIPKMTRSEIMALMTGGMATIAGSVMGAYIGFLGGDDPQAQAEFARMFLCASLMNAPAALLVAKLLVPESQPVNEDLSVPRSHAGRNALDAIATGTTQGLKLALNVAAMLVAFLALIALLNWILGLVGGLGQDGGAINRAVASTSGGVFDSLSLEALLGFLFAPVAWLIGIESSDLLLIGQLLGKKVAANEFVAYLDLGSMKAASQVSPRSVFIATFALCGFANFGSIGIQIGGIGALAPEQRPMLAELGLKALLGGTLASLLTASLAGMFFAG